MLILILESSTTSAKAMLFDTDTKMSSVKTELYPYMSENATLHDAETVFQTTVKVGRELAAGKEIAMISLCTTWHSVMLCDQSVRPASPVYLWSYTEAAGLCGEVRKNVEKADDYYRRTGCPVTANYPSFKLMYLKEKEKKDLSQFLIMGQGTYNMFRLTGKRVVTECLASGSGMLNIHTRSWEPSVLREIGIDESQLCRLVPSDSTWPLDKTGADLLGVREGIPVVPANSDGGLNQLGSGAVQEGIMTFSVGTSGAMRVSSLKPVTPARSSAWCYLSPKSWLLGIATSGSCNCIDWFRHNIARDADYEELETKDRILSDTPVFLPFLFGERAPGWNEAKQGGFLGVRPEHDIRSLYRAVQECVLFNLYQGFLALCELNGEPDRIKLSGGILHSPTWVKMCADIFQKELEIDDMVQGSLYGGAVLAAEILGIDLMGEETGTAGKTVEPEKENAEVYMRKFQRYIECYQKN